MVKTKSINIVILPKRYFSVNIFANRKIFSALFLNVIIAKILKGIIIEFFSMDDFPGNHSYLDIFVSVCIIMLLSWLYL
jgi:hypothetical protein